MAASRKVPAIGIDLGTTFSCVGVLHNGKVHIIKTAKGESTIPSYVAFTEKGRLVGEEAREYSITDPENTVYNVKRLIGRTMDDDAVKKQVASSPFRVVEGQNGKPFINVTYKDEDKLFSPEEISAAVLAELKTMAEEYLDLPTGTIKEAVITVPASFNDAQRQATIDAGRIAELHVLETINEPTAAALAYGFDNKENEEESTLLVYDFGGGTFDASVVTVDNGHVKVLCSRGDPYLGGEDIDNLMVKHHVSEFLRQHWIDLNEKAKTDRTAKRALRRLQHACAKAKITLSDKRSAKISLLSLYDGKDFEATIQRTFFEDMCIELVRNTMTSVIEAVEQVNLAIAEISKIVLVGGSSRIPLVGHLLKEVFCETEFYGSINPDEAVAYGAAIKAAILAGVDRDVLRGVHLSDVVSMSLGVETYGGMMSRVIRRGTPVPALEKKTFTTSRDYQMNISFAVYEGEYNMTSNNHLLGEFTLVSIPPAPRRVPQIEVTFDVDASGILKVKALDLSTETESEVEITNRGGRMSQDEINRAVRDAEEMREKDQKFKRKIEARDRLDVLAKKIADSLKQTKMREKIEEKINAEHLQKLEEKVDECLRMYESFQNSEQADFEKKLTELENLWSPVLTIIWPERQNTDFSIFTDEDTGRTGEQTDSRDQSKDSQGSIHETADSRKAPAIGIDLGTTYSCVAVLHDGEVHVIKSANGKSMIPSYVAFTENGRLVGEEAREYSITDPENTVYNMTRLIGRTMDDEHVIEQNALSPFKVVEGLNGKLCVQLENVGEDKLFSLEEILAAVVGELKTMAEEYLNMRVTEAVITVPAYFTDAQRQATVDAGRIAGLNVLEIVDEATAAVLAYGFDRAARESPLQEVYNLLVYHLGGATCDASVVSLVNGYVEVLSCQGNSNLGGKDIDELVVQHCVSEFHKTYGIDLDEKAKTEASAKRALERLQLQSERVKIALSDARSTSIECLSLYDGKDLETTIRRTCFEELCDPLVWSTLALVIEAVEDANLSTVEITNIVLVGGSSRVPLVGRMLHELFEVAEIYGSIDPQEAVAYGAAIKAAILTGADMSDLCSALY